VLASGDRYEVTLSPVIEDFRLRFGGVPLREDDPLVSVELVGPEDVPQIVELWRPPRLALPGLVPPASRLAPPAVGLVPPARNE
jgi:hypothetical protein